MKLQPGSPLEIGLLFDEAGTPRAVGRAAMAGGLAQLEWSREVIAARLPVSGLLYIPEPGLQAARGRDFDGLHGFLHDSLPEGWGYLVMRRRLMKLGVRIEEMSPLDRLALVGTEGRGALVYRPATTPAPEVESLDLDALATDAAILLTGEDGRLADTLAALGGGSGGARPKVHVGFDPVGNVSVGQGEILAGHQAWIVKFGAPSDPIDIGPIEAAYAAMAQAAGVDMAPHRILPSRQGPGYFAARRFDRPEPGRRRHMISLSGLIEAPSRSPSSYDLFLRATFALTRRAGDVNQAFRRMVFNLLACNRDDHTRQHSYLMDEGGEWRLSPAYDLTFSIGPGGEHYLDIEGEGRNPTRDHVLALGKRHGVGAKAVGEVIEAVRAATSDWRRFADDAGVGGTSRAVIQKAIEAVSKAF